MELDDVRSWKGGGVERDGMWRHITDEVVPKHVPGAKLTERAQRGRLGDRSILGGKVI